MKMFIFILIACVSYASAELSEISKVLVADTYDRTVKPKGQLNVGISVYIEYAKWHNNELQLSLYLRQSWKDERLKRSKNAPTRFSAQHLLDHIWTPNTYIVSALNPRVVEEGVVDISPAGEVWWSEARQFVLPCKADVKRINENDGVVNCTMIIRSYSLVTDDLSYQWTDKTPVASSNIGDDLKSSDTENTKLKFASGEYGAVVAKMNFQTKFRKAVSEFVMDNAS